MLRLSCYAVRLTCYVLRVTFYVGTCHVVHGISYTLRATWSVRFEANVLRGTCDEVRVTCY